MGLKVDMAWPSKETTVQYQGRDVVLRPETGTQAASIVVRTDERFGQDDAGRLIQEFLSSLTWVRGSGAIETFGMWCSAAPMEIGKSSGKVINDAPIDYLPDSTDPRVKRALALYREACVVNVVPYQFLGFYKILEVLYRSRPEQIRWVNATIGKLKGRDISERAKAIRSSGADLGQYLYDDGRCAIAHAHDADVVNPDNVADLRRLSEDLPLVRALAEYLIEHELNVQSEASVIEEHLYELGGFRRLFGDEVCAKLKAKQPVNAGEVPVPPKLSLRLQGKAQLATFAGMEAVTLSNNEGVLVLRCQSQSKLLVALVRLDFPAERLTCNAFETSYAADDGTASTAAMMLDELDFFIAWVANGVVEVLDAQSGSRLGRSKPVFEELTNMRVDWNQMQAQRATLLARLGRPTTD